MLISSSQLELSSQIAAHTVLAEVNTNSQHHTARLGKRTALPPSNEPRLKQRNSMLQQKMNKNSRAALKAPLLLAKMPQGRCLLVRESKEKKL